MTAARGVECKHLACFDLRGYLLHHTIMTYWECPFVACKAEIQLNHLRVDEYVRLSYAWTYFPRRYFTSIVGSVGQAVDEVELLADGTFKTMEKQVPDAIVIEDSPQGSPTEIGKIYVGKGNVRRSKIHP